ncbi:MAG: translation initiation factor IF-2 [Chroococcales cyanobacterium]
MGFAELSIAQIAEEYNLPIEEVFRLCNQQGIRYKNEQTCLALEDAKAIISEILSNRQGSTSQ